MAFLLKGIAVAEGVPTNGLQVVAYKESRFSGTVPVYGSPFPDMSAADAGPVTSGESFGRMAGYQLTVPDATNYYVGCYAIGDPNQIISWIGPQMATPHTSLQGWTDTGQYGPVSYADVTIAAGSNGVTLPVAGGIINLNSATSLSASGTVAIYLGGSNWQVVAYTGKSGTTITGCTGGTGTLATNQHVTQAYAGSATLRRLLIVQLDCTAFTATDFAQANVWTIISGVVSFMGTLGVTRPGFTSPGSGWHLSATVPVDPGGYWWLDPEITGTGSLTLSESTYVDF